MRNLLKIIISVIGDYSRHIGGAKIKEYQSEDSLSKDILEQELLKTNSGRVFLFAVPAVILSIVFSVMTIAGMNRGDIRESILCLSGLLLIVFGCGSTAVLVYRGYRGRKTDKRKLRGLIFSFWLIFSIGLLLITIADFSVNVFAWRFYLYLAVMTIVPLFDIKVSAVLIAPYLVLNLFFGAVFGADFVVLALAVVFSLAYLVTSGLVYSSHCCLVIGDRRLNTANERVRQMDEKDSLTGMLNKKGLSRRLMDIIDRGVDRNIAAVFFDIDDFREYNHCHKDQEGDQCLYNICNCIRITAKSKTDIVSRYGGDEFVLILQDVKEYDLIYFAEQLRSSVERMAQPFTDGKDGRIVTVSVGVSSIIEGELEDYSGLLKEAEDSLVLAKKGGKNCVAYLGNVFRAIEN